MLSLTAIILILILVGGVLVYGDRGGYFYSVFLAGSGGAAGAERVTSLGGFSALLLRLLVSDIVELRSLRRAASWGDTLAFAL